MNLCLLVQLDAISAVHSHKPHLISKVLDKYCTKTSCFWLDSRLDLGDVKQNHSLTELIMQAISLTMHQEPGPTQRASMPPCHIKAQVSMQRIFTWSHSNAYAQQHGAQCGAPLFQAAYWLQTQAKHIR